VKKCYYIGMEYLYRVAPAHLMVRHRSGGRD